jgi:hydroxybutyrate-dimer hydrolase
VATSTVHADGPFNRKPTFISGDIVEKTYDGATDDLLTGGLGESGLEDGAPAPGFTDPDNPTDAELRISAIYNNYRALVPTNIGNGYGVFFGPNIDAGGADTGTEGRVAGTEYLAFATKGKSGKENVTLMVQVPDSFDPESPCIVTAPSSGSRGIYGAIGTAGEWGLKNACAVAYTDKGTGTGAHDLQDNTVNTITGQREDANTAGKASHFTARMSDPRRNAFNADTPDRFAFKHAHSRENPEQDWGESVLQSIELAFYLLNETYGEPGPGGKIIKTITPDNTIVIASSVSNGGGASVRAAEQDRRGLIDGVAVSEPNVNPVHESFGIRQGAGTPLFDHSRSLYDYITLLNVYQGCASAAPANAAAPFNFAPSPAACTSLAAKGLLAGGDTNAQAAEAQQIINDFGIIPEQNVVQPSHWWANVPQTISVTNANAYGKISVLDNLCGYSFGATDPASADPIPLASAVEQALFGTSNGIPPTGGVNLINNDSLGGPRENRASLSPSTGSADQNVDGSLCLRSLATGVASETGEKLNGPLKGASKKIARGVRSIRARGDLHGLPAIFVTGRNDAILPINHTSRAYYGLNQVEEGAQSGLRYYEITNAHHLDIFNRFPTFNELFIPLHHYLFQALDLMLDHLKNGTTLPPSQVVHTVPRGPGAPPLTAANVPDIAASPAAGDAITFSDNILHIPD